MSNVEQCCLVVAIKLILYFAYFTLGKRARDDSFLDTIMAMDCRAMVFFEIEKDIALCLLLSLQLYMS